MAYVLILLAGCTFLTSVTLIGLEVFAGIAVNPFSPTGESSMSILFWIFLAVVSFAILLFMLFMYIRKNKVKESPFEQLDKETLSKIAEKNRSHKAIYEDDD